MYSNEQEASFLKKNHSLSLLTHGEFKRLFRKPWCPEPGTETVGELGGEPQM